MIGMPKRGEKFPSQNPLNLTPEYNNAQDALKPVSSETPTTTTATVTRNHFPLPTIEEYIRANPHPNRDLHSNRLSCTDAQILAYKRRLDDCHDAVIAFLQENLCTFNMYTRYECGQIIKGKILATLVIHVRPRAKHDWATIRCNIKKKFEGLGALFKDGWDLIYVDFEVKQ
jgi:hypothetical protein